MEKTEAKLLEKKQVYIPKIIKDILEFPGIRVTSSHTLTTVWSYFKEFPHDLLPVFKDVFSDDVDGVIYPQSILLLRDKRDDKKIDDIKNNVIIININESLNNLYNIIKNKNIPGAVVVDENGKYAGIATIRGLLEAVRHMSPKVKSVNAVYTLRGEGGVEYVREGDDIAQLTKKIAGGEAAGAVVEDERGFIRGVITVWDYITTSRWLRPLRRPMSIFGRGAGRGEPRQPRAPSARALVSTGTPAVTPSTSVEDAARAMASLGIYVLPVVDREERIIGALTALDVLRAYFEGAKEGREDLEPERPLEGALEARPREIARLGPIKYATGVRAADLLSTNMPSVGLLDSISHIRRVMVKTGAHVVAVVNESGKSVGFISRRDLLFYIASRSLGYWKAQKGKRLILRESAMPGEQAKLLKEEGTASDLIKVDVPRIPSTATAEEVAYTMLTAGTDYVLVLDERGEPSGVVSKEALVKAYADKGRENAVVADLMTPPDIAVVNPLHSLFHIVDRMKAYEIDGVVVAEGNDVRGIIADSRLSLVPVEESLRGERIFVVTKRGERRKGAGRLRYPKAGTLTAIDVADDAPSPVPPAMSAKEAAKLLLTHDVLPVLDQRGRLVGVLTKFDIVRDLARSYVAFKSPETSATRAEGRA